MKNDLHLMLDLETLGHNSDAAIIQIGACIFNSKSIIDSMKVDIKWKSALEYGNATAETLEWWFMQSREAQSSLFEGQEHSSFAHTKFYNFCLDMDIKHFWAHATFDFPIFTNLCNNLNVTNPIDFRKCRDLRTMDALFPLDPWPKREGIHHDALDDAIYQTKVLQKQFQAI